MRATPADGDRRDLGSDIGAAFGLAVVEVFALAVIAGHYWISGWSFDPARSPRYGPVWGHLVAIGVVGALAGWAAWRAFRRGATVTAWGQGLMAGLVILVVCAGAAGQVREDAGRRPAPEATFTGEVGCRSGGGSHECADTGG
ncbi:MAG TPA: DUF6234 family protein [Thermomonospora sp.]|nr:DUF6234 family protein [Thermomonospora sp.]